MSSKRLVCFFNRLRAGLAIMDGPLLQFCRGSSSFSFLFGNEARFLLLQQVVQSGRLYRFQFATHRKESQHDKIPVGYHDRSAA